MLLMLAVTSALGCDRRTTVVPPSAQLPPAQPTDLDDYHPAGTRLLFSDEFDGDALDRRAWCTRYVFGGGPPLQVADAECEQAGSGTLDFLNDEQQRYRDTDSRGHSMHEVAGGQLTLLATAGPSAGQYEAGMIRSKRLFKPDDTKYLYITARVHLPSVRGTWPAFWLNSDRNEQGAITWPPEIDIFEAPLNGVEDKDTMLKLGAVTRGKPYKMAFMHKHFDERWRNYHADQSLRDKWVETAVLWKSDSVCYFVDGTKVMCEGYRWVHEDGRQAPAAHILLNLAIGGSWAGRHGVDDAKLPARFLVDHVRVYEGMTAS
jgi:beta-glucanase (GH16 family)